MQGECSWASSREEFGSRGTAGEGPKQREQASEGPEAEWKSAGEGPEGEQGRSLRTRAQ